MRILCAENSPVSFAGISILLSVEGYTNVSKATNYAEMKRTIATDSFDLLITELRFVDAELLDVVGQVCQSFPNTKILIYTYYENPTYLARASACKLYDFVLKRMSTSYLLRSITEAPGGVAPPESLLTMSTNFLTHPELLITPKTEHLTKRELQILTHLALGLSNREIGSVLGISLETVKEHVQNVLRKLKANDRTEAAVWALRNGVPTLKLP